MTTITESRLRIIVGGILWAVAGSLTLSLFLTMAGDNWLKIVVACVWAVGLVAGEILCWRKGGGYRAIAVVIVIIQIFSAFGAAVTAGEHDGAKSYDAQILKIRESAEYRTAAENEISARRSKSTLEARLLLIPGDYTTAAQTIRTGPSGIADQDAKIKEYGDTLTRLEKTAGSGNRGMFEIIAGGNAKLLEIIISLILATITEIAALALSGKAKPVPIALDTRTVVTNAVPKPDPTCAVTWSQYFAAMKKRHAAGLPYGRRVMSELLGISERQARYILADLMERGLVQSRGEVGK